MGENNDPRIQQIEAEESIERGASQLHKKSSKSGITTEKYIYL